MRWLLIVLLPVLSACGSIWQEAKPVKTAFHQRIEAEDPHNVIEQKLVVGPCPVRRCSGGKAVVDIGWGNGIESPVSVPETGLYRLTIHYSLGANEVRGGVISVNGLPVATVEFPSTGDWLGFKDAVTLVPLRAGKNIIRFDNPRYWHAGMDYFELSSDIRGVTMDRILVLPSRSVLMLADTSQIPLWIFMIGVSTLAGLVSIFFLWRILRADRSRTLVRESLIVLIAVATTSLAGYLLELLDATLIGSETGFLIRQAFLVLTSPAFLVFALRYTGNHRAFTLPVKVTLWGFVLACVIVYGTNPWLGLANTGPTLTLERRFLPLIHRSDGWGHQVVFALGAMMMFTTLGVFGLMFNRVSRLYRLQITSMIGAVLLVYLVGYLIARLFNSVGVGNDLYFVALGLACSILLMTYAIFRLQLATLHPSVWGQAEGVPSDIALALDNDGRIIEINESGRSVLTLLPGQPLPERNQWMADSQVNLNGQTYQVNRSAVAADHHQIGELITLHNITEQSRIEQALRDSNNKLEELQSDLRDQANKDALTTLYNRRYLNQQLEIEINQALVQGHDLGLVLFDIDYFRNFNSRFGYAGGDKVLQFISGFTLQHLPNNAIACRYGGEEFCVLLPHASLEEVERWAQDFCTALAAQRCEINGVRLEVNISASCASLLEHGPQALLLSADDTLREAKRRGRGRVLKARSWQHRWGSGWV